VLHETGKYKGKVIPMLKLIYSFEGVWGREGIALPFLVLAPDGDEWFPSYPCHFTLEEIAII
jgi:hypothetical protein